MAAIVSYGNRRRCFVMWRDVRLDKTTGDLFVAEKHVRTQNPKVK